MNTATKNDTIQYIQINKLAVSPLNMRKSEASKVDNDKLKASIKGHGVKQNLIVFPTSKTKFGVVAGGRRFSQVMALVEENHFKKTDTLPCLIATSEQEAIELSIIENTHRADANPADEFEAYQAAKTAGADVKGIAERFGVKQKHVKQRLKLAAVAPEILQSFRNKTLSLDCLMAFTIEPDHAAQIEVLKAVSSNPNFMQPWRIKEQLTAGALKSTDRIARFIDTKEYKKRGGTISSDLFSQESFLDNTTLATEIANEQLQALGHKLPNGWLWFETHPKLPDHEYVRNLLAIKSTPPAEMAEQQEALLDRLEELEKIYYENEYELSAEQEKEQQELEEKSTALENEMEKQATFDPHEQALAGIIITLDCDGNPEYHMGRVRTANRPALQALQQGENTSSTPTSTTATTNSNATPDEEGYSQALSGDLAATRKLIAQAHLASRPELALDLLHYSVCYRALGDTRWENALDLQASPTYSASHHPSTTDGQAFELLNTKGDSINRNWLHIDDKREQFIAFQALPAADKTALIAYCTALTLNVELSDGRNAVSEEVIKQMDITWADHWSPTKANFLGRIGKPQLIELGTPYMPAAWPAEAEKKKKGDLAEELELVFQGNDERMSDEQRRQALQWMPTGF